MIIKRWNGDGNNALEEESDKKEKNASTGN